MLTRQKVLHLILALLKEGDICLISSGKALRGELCSEADRKSIGRMAEIIGNIYDSYDYLLSPEFAESLRGKSEKYCEVRSSLERAPQKKKVRKEEFIAAVRRLQQDKRIYDLVDSSRHAEIDEVVDLLSNLGLPAE